MYECINDIFRTPSITADNRERSFNNHPAFIAPINHRHHETSTNCLVIHIENHKAFDETNIFIDFFNGIMRKQCHCNNRLNVKCIHHADDQPNLMFGDEISVGSACCVFNHETLSVIALVDSTKQIPALMGAV